MKKRVRLAGRYLLLYAMVFGFTVGLISLSCMPVWMTRAFAAVSVGWLAFRYIAWTINRPRRVRR